MSRSRRPTRLALWAVVVALTSMSPARGAGDDEDFALPHELAVAELEASEAIFDGDYAEALRLSEKAMHWLREGDHRLLLARLGFDWSTREAQVKCLQGQAFYYMGNEKRAIGALDSAARQLQPRRLYWQKKFLEATAAKGLSEDARREAAKRSALEVSAYIFYDAFIEMLKGEMQSPVPDFGVAELLDPTTLKAWRELYGDTGKAGVCFRAAREKVLQVEGGLRNYGGPESLPDDVERMYRRSRLRMFVSFARLECWGGGGRGSLDVRMRDADNLLARAEDAMKGDTFWSTFLSPDSLFAIRYADLDELKKNAAAEVDLTDVIRVKQLFAQSSDDYLAIMMTRAEVAELEEPLQRRAAARAGVAWTPEQSEQWYQQALLFVRGNFAARHPLVRKLEMSKGRWYATRSLPPAGAIKDQDVRRLVSMARDCLQHARRIGIEHERNLTVRERLELRFLELRAIQNLLDIHTRTACFQPGQIASLDAGKKAAIGEIETIIKPMIAAAAAARN